MILHSCRLAALVFAFLTGLGLAQRQPDLVRQVITTPETKTFAGLLKDVNLVETLQGEGPFTILAPTDAAFARLPEETRRSVLDPARRDRLRSILEYHVLPGRFDLDALASRRAFGSLEGRSVAFSVDAEGRLRVNGKARFGGINALASNGFVHRIDEVLLPPEQDLVEVAAAAGNFKTLIAAAQAAGLADDLRGEGPFTVLAPTDEAFGALGKDAVQSLLRPENKKRLAAILRFHVLPGRILASDAVGAGQVESLLKRGVLDFAIREGRLRVENANMIANDVVASNGVIHVIDRVLMPPSGLLPKSRPAGRKIIGVTLESPSAALAAQLGIDRRRCSVVSKVTRGGSAERAGLERYDVIVSIDGGDGNLATLKRVKKAREVGDIIELVVLRQGERRHLKVPVGFVAH